MKHVHVAAAVFLQDNRVFSAKRKDEGEMASRWEFPGGKLEPGESGEDAIVREIKEELDTDISVVRYLTTVEHRYRTFSITMEAYLCTIERGNLTLSEHQASRWLSKAELHDVPWADADLPIVAAVEGLLE